MKLGNLGQHGGKNITFLKEDDALTLNRKENLNSILDLLNFT